MQVDSVREGVHLEPIALYVWKLTGKETRFLVREDVRKPRRVGRKKCMEMRTVWIVKREQFDKVGAEFDSAGSALAHAYAHVGAIRL